LPVGIYPLVKTLDGILATIVSHGRLSVKPKPKSKEFPWPVIVVFGDLIIVIEYGFWAVVFFSTSILLFYFALMFFDGRGK
jgi:hypothetical protein